MAEFQAKILARNAAEIGSFEQSLAANSAALDLCGTTDEKLALSILVHYNNVTFAQWSARLRGVTSLKSSDQADFRINHG